MNWLEHLLLLLRAFAAGYNSGSGKKGRKR
jgi:hypothetical protein